MAEEYSIADLEINIEELSDDPHKTEHEGDSVENTSVAVKANDHDSTSQIPESDDSIVIALPSSLI